MKDSNDRHADVERHEPKPIASVADDDDEFESSSLLELKAEPVAAGGMRPGLAGEHLDDTGIEVDLDDADDPAESEL